VGVAYINLLRLAQNPISNICAGLIGIFREIINLGQFIKLYCQSPIHFEGGKRIVSNAALRKTRMKLEYEFFTKLIYGSRIIRFDKYHPLCSYSTR